MRKLIINLLACLLLNGCASITHDFTDKDGNHDKGKAVGFLTTSAITNLKTNTKNGPYSHSTAGEGINITGDAAFIQALSEGIAKGVVQALKTSQGIP